MSDEPTERTALLNAARSHAKIPGEAALSRPSRPPLLSSSSSYLCSSQPYNTALLLCST